MILTHAACKLSSPERNGRLSRNWISPSLSLMFHWVVHHGFPWTYEAKCQAWSVYVSHGQPWTICCLSRLGHLRNITKLQNWFPMDTTNTQTFNAWHSFKAGTLEHPNNCIGRISRPFRTEKKPLLKWSMLSNWGQPHVSGKSWVIRQEQPPSHLGQSNWAMFKIPPSDSVIPFNPGWLRTGISPFLDYYNPQYSS